tara:strand:+ start:2109 stop:2675 length:567 start_codon:yes stop_codon:yes gene_type:complete
MDYLEYQVPVEMINIFRKQAEQKIASEGWGKQGRNISVKVDNFVHCWTTEEAFKQLLIKEEVWFRNRGLYFGDSQGAGADFTVKINGEEVTIGLRSVAPLSLTKYKQVAYPDDRIRLNEKIADFHIVCNHDKGYSKFFGIISREELLAAVSDGKRLYSKKNQEYFRVIPLEKFNYEKLVSLITKMEKI